MIFNGFLNFYGATMQQRKSALEILKEQEEARKKANQLRIAAALGKPPPQPQMVSFTPGGLTFVGVPIHDPNDPATAAQMAAIHKAMQDILMAGLGDSYGNREPSSTSQSHPTNPAYRGTVCTWPEAHHAARFPNADDSGRTLEGTGIRAGEIIGWRAWRIIDALSSTPYLSSTYTNALWEPDGIMRGRPHPYRTVEPTGVHCWKDKDTAIDYVTLEIGRAIIGTVKIWGEVIEFEKGYRAEFAKINSLDYYSTVSPSSGWLDLSFHARNKLSDKHELLIKLRQHYKVGALE